MRSFHIFHNLYRISFLVCFFLLTVQQLEFGRNIQQDLEQRTMNLVASIDADLSPFLFLPKMLQNRVQLSRDILSLELENRQLQSIVAQNNQLVKENDELKAEFVSNPNAHLEWIPAKITVFPENDVLTVGKTEGVWDHAMVLSHGSLLGIVADVSDHTSKVLRAGTEAVTVGVAHQKSGEKGVLIEEAGYPQVNFLTLVSGISVGDDIVTVADEHGIISGILVGTVDQILTTISDPVTKVRIKLTALPQLDTEVFVQYVAKE